MRLNRLDTRKLALALVAAFVWIGCNEQETVTDPEAAQPAGVPAIKNIVAALECTANVVAEELSCGEAEGLQGVLDPRFLIVGGQGVFVNLVSSNVMYDGGSELFSADVQVQSLIAQQMGTPDGTEVTGVNVFFHTGPSVTDGTGDVTVSNPDDFGDFTGVNQPFHQYLVVLPPAPFITAAKNWHWDVPTTVNTFVFEVFVQADVPGENGHVVVDPPNAFLNPAEQVTLSSTIFDVVGRAQAGAVTYSSSDETVATVDMNTGEVTAVGGGRAEITATTGGPEADGIAVITVFEADYQIELRFLTAVTMTQQAAFENARDRWEAIITADLSNVLIDTDLQPSCSDGPINEIIDDLVINVILAPIDGPGNILGSAGPCWIRGGTFLPIYGRMTFDTDDLDAIEADGQLEDVILHEMGHVIGIGTVWDLLGLLLDVGDVPADCSSEETLDDPYFDGPMAITEFDDAGGTTYTGEKVPAEDTGGPGTRCGHWREDVFETELMTGFISAPMVANPLSRITIASLEDIGYSVDLNQADAYSLPMPFPALAHEQEGLRLVDDVWLGPVYAVDEDGTVTQVLPDRRPEWQKQLDLLNRAR